MMTSMISRRWLDLGERTVMTYAQAFLGILVADSSHLITVSALRAAAIAALPAALAAIKAAFALGLGPTGTASLLPAPKPAAPVSPVPEPPAPGGGPAAK